MLLGIQRRCSSQEKKILSNLREVRGIESSFRPRYLYLVAFYHAPRAGGAEATVLGQE